MQQSVSRTLVRPLFAVATLLACGACVGPLKQPAKLAPTNVPAWAETTLQVTGRGAYPENVSGPRARLMAERAARTDAYRKLTEEVYGLELRTGTTVRDAVLADDQIHTEVEGFIRGARVTATRDRADMGFVEMDMELGLGRKFQRMVFRR